MKKYYYLEIWDDFSIINNYCQEKNNLIFICEYIPELTELFWKQYSIKLNRPTLSNRINKVVFDYCKRHQVPYNFVVYQDETCNQNEAIEEISKIKIIINNEDILDNNEISLGGFYYFLRNISDKQKENIKNYFQMIYLNQQKSLLKRKK